jgi:hypothetical protein
VSAPKRYGFTDAGTCISPPKPDRYGPNAGVPWNILPEGAPIPQKHREFIDYMGTQTWCEPRRCHSTMTPPNATVFGSVRAFAVRADLAL